MCALTPALTSDYGTVPSRLRAGLFFQPQTQIISHRLNNFVAGNITAVSHVARAGAQLRGVIFGARRRIEFIALSTQMKY